MKVSIDKYSKVPVYLQIADQIKSQIISGALPRGSALPSERALAQILDVHRNTVVKAYSELKSDAWIESRQGVGYVVAAANDENDAQDERGGEGTQPGRVNWVSEVAEKYLDMEKTFDDLFQRFTDESHYSLGSGVASREVYTSERVAGDIATLLTGSGPCQYFFSPYKGDKFLRQKLVAFLGTKGVKASSGEIQILSETNQALDFIVTLLVKPGDRAGAPGHVPRDGACGREDTDRSRRRERHELRGARKLTHADAPAAHLRQFELPRPDGKHFVARAAQEDR